MKTRHFRIVATLAITTAIAACVVDPLNPQPLPPGPNEGVSFADGGLAAPVTSDAATGADSGNLKNDDAAVPPNTPADGGDAGDGASDAAADADAY
jgi:hypothetical protein